MPSQTINSGRREQQHFKTHQVSTKTLPMQTFTGSYWKKSSPHTNEGVS